jgi:hypothetical protein
MDETLMWVLILAALALMAVSAVRPEVLSAWWHARFDPWWNRIHPH